MARRLRVEEVGYYHIINRGVECRDVFLCADDKDTFIEIVDESALLYRFVVHTFCLMDNHYHLLLEIKENNLSLLMRQINSRYSIYFNRKYERVGPLWQGRFKSWYVYDKSYLYSLIKYIESNPVKAGLAEVIGDFCYASSYYLRPSTTTAQVIKCLDLRLLEQLNATVGLLGKYKDIVDERDQEHLAVLHNAKFDKQSNGGVVRLKKQPLSQYELLDCDKSTRNNSMIKAIHDGYRQSELADYLGISNVLVSKVMKHYRAKVTLFERYKDKGLFWSYSKEISFEQLGNEGLCEVLLKYGGFQDLKLGLQVFGRKTMQQVWLEKQADDQRFIRLNLFLARVVFSMNVESNYFQDKENHRYEKLKLLAG